jgi:multimeric flavodoxin WrbA
MKITVLDGQNTKENKSWANYMRDLVGQLKTNGHDVQHVVLMDKNIHTCTGCFGCWVKTPGMCVIADDSQAINREVIQSDFVLWASPLLMGFPSAHLKTKMDRTIPLVHPYFEVVNDEAHHLARYEKYPVFGLLLQPGEVDDAETVEIVSQVFARTALNIKSWLAFAETTDLEVKEVTEKIERACRLKVVSQHPPKPALPTAQVKPVKRLLVINGSPRGVKANSSNMLQKLMDGFLSVDGASAEMLHLAKAADRKKLEEVYSHLDAVILGFPLYTDAMPGLVKQTIESLAQFTDRTENPAMAFLVQSGFPEAAHSRYIERYLQTLAARLHSPYLGSLVRGGCEGVHLMPESMNKKMFATLHTLGEQLAQQGGFEAQSVKALVSVEQYSKVLLPLFRIAVKTPFTKLYWDSQLNANQAYDRRFAQPYADAGK